MVVEASIVERALDLGSFLPAFQPVVELRTGRLIGFELLARWQHSELGLLMPDSFIEVAQEANLLPRLTRQILDGAFRASVHLPAPLRLSVNISPLQLRDENLPEQIYEAAKAGCFPLNRLTVEITETALVDNHEKAQEITRELKKLGCRLLLDDFGTGYSSLKHLQKLHFDGLKIDKSFIADITEIRESRKIVAAFIGLGQSLGLTTVGEGIESEEQASLLLYLGCDAGQGWFYGRPAMAASLPELVRSPPPRLAPKWSPPKGAFDLASFEALPAQRIAQLQAIYDGAPVGLAFINSKLCYVSVNQRFAHMNKVPAISMIGQSIAAMFPKWFPLYEPYLLRALAGEAIADVVITRPSLTAGGTDQTILISYEPAKDEGGEVIGISMALVDISEREMKERALRDSEEKYRTMIDLNPDIPWILSPGGDMTDYGVRWEAITGLSRKQTLNRGFLDAIHPEDRDRISRSLMAAIGAGLVLDLAYRVRRRDGRYIWMRSRGSALLDEQGAVLNYFGSTEITDDRDQMQVAV